MKTQPGNEKFHYNVFYDKTRKKRKKLDKILMLAKGKLSSIDTLISQALTDMDISHKNLLQF